MILHTSNYVEIIYEKENSLIIDKFLSATEEMETEDFKKEMLVFAKKCEKYKPERELVYLLDMKYSIVPDVQEWINNNIFPRYKNIIKRMAFLMPEDLIIQMSIEQTMEEKTGEGFTQAYFDSEQKARKWLMEK